MKLTSAAVAFRKGWHDRINGVPPGDRGDTPCDQTSTAVYLGYERGRHAAALYQFEASQRERGTINRTYAQARLDMSVTLRKMIDAERRFCALKPRKRNPLSGL
jgi:hypothetical protein